MTVRICREPFSLAAALSTTTTPHPKLRSSTATHTMGPPATGMRTVATALHLLRTHRTLTMATTTTALSPAPAPASGRRSFASLRINGARMMEALHATCEFGKAHRYGDAPTETGMARLSLDDNDKKARDWFAEQAAAVGCTVTVDQLGNQFAIRPGKCKTPGVAPVVMGSHLDTQPTGGRYDGILGVMAGLEALRTIHENGYETEGPVGVVNWTNEEGARFPLVTVASAVWAGALPLETAWGCTETTPPADPEAGPQTMKQELARIGYLGTVPASFTAQPLAAHFELHIEQGPILEQEERAIGVVTRGQACWWYEVEVRGRDCHAGTTPFNARSDALLAAAKMIAASNAAAKTAQAAGGTAVVTTGRLHAFPGSINTMAHTVRFTLDIRDATDAGVADLAARCRAAFDTIAADDSERGVTVSWTTLAENSAVNFDPDCIRAVEAAAEDVCRELPAYAAAAAQGRSLWKHMLSGATHDSCNVSRRCPTAMVFTPTKDGLSHTPVEYCSPDECVAGAQVLLGAVLRYDAARKL